RHRRCAGALGLPLPPAVPHGNRHVPRSAGGGIGMKRPALTPLTLALACSLSTPALAQSHDHAHHHHAPAKTSAGGGSESIVRDPVAHESTDGHEHHEHHEHHGHHERHEHHGH